jgi:lipopolysaccharide/colanic/teichoic acid biosynthesis glycosyltransferase
MGSADISRGPTIRQRGTAASCPGRAIAPAARSSARRFVIRVGSSAMVLFGDTLALMTPLLSDPRQFSATMFMAGLSLLLIARAGRYRTSPNLSVLDVAPAIVSRLVMATTVIATIIGLEGGQEAVATFLRNCAMVVVLVIGGRVMTARLIGWRRERSDGLRRTLMVGGGTLTAELADVLDNHANYGLAVMGFVDDCHDCAASDLVPWLGRLSDVDLIVRNTGADTLIVTLEEGAECALLNMLRAPGCLACDIFAVPRLYHLRVHPAPIDHIGSVPVVRILRPKLTGPWSAIKRATDVAISGLLLAVLWPVAALWIFAKRIGDRARATARHAHAGHQVPVFHWPATIVQLWNVLRGNMSFVGPRPDRPDRTIEISRKYECYRLRQRTRAGLTGLAQINGRYGYLSAHENARYDNYYIENWSPWLDVRIVATALCQFIAAR